MNELQIFDSHEFGQIRMAELDGKMMFVAADVAKALGYTKTRNAIATHCKGALKQGILTNGGMQEMTVIPEGDVYRLVVGSKLPSADKFERWLFDEVVPSIRKHGAYMTKETLEQVLTSPDTIIKLAQQIKAEQEARAAAESQVLALTETTARQEQLIGELKPKADYTDRILQNKGLVTITQIAKDYGMSGQAMNEKLHEMKIIYKLGKQWLLYVKYHGKGYTHSETVDFTRKDGTPDVTMNTKWTQKGRLFLYNELKKVGILPTIERGEESAA